MAPADSPKTLCFDLDNTLCSTAGMDYEAAEPFEWAIERVNRLAAAGHRILIMTARGSATGIDWEPVTRAQLERWGVTYHELHFGKPPADVFIDDRAVHTTAWQLDDAFGAPVPLAAPDHLTSVVETGRTYAGRTLRLAEHAERIRELAHAAGVRAVPSVAEVERAVATSLPAGAGDVAFAIRVSDTGSAAYPEAWDAATLTGLRVSCRPIEEAARGLVPFLEGDGEPALRAALEPGAGEAKAWPLHRLGEIVGAVHAVRLTLSGPPSVAGSWLEELAAGLDIEIEHRDPPSGDLAGADEAFVVALPFCLLPVASIDGRPVGDQAPGRVTRRLLDAWSADAGVDLAAQNAAPTARSPEVPASP